MYPEHSYIMQEKYRVEAIAKTMPDLKNVYVLLLYYPYVPSGYFSIELSANLLQFLTLLI